MKENEIRAAKLNDTELDAVNGGWYVRSDTFKTADEVTFKWAVGEHVEKVTSYFMFHVFTKGCTVTDRKAAPKEGTDGFCAWYKIQTDDSDNGKWFSSCSSSMLFLFISVMVFLLFCRVSVFVIFGVLCCLSCS